MLPTRNRLSGAKNFEKVKKEGKLYQSEDFGVAVLYRGDDDFTRFGFIISTKVAKAAVHRNRVLRAFRQAVRQHLKDFNDGYDIVFLAKKSVLTKTTDEIMKQVRLFLRKNKLTK
jgi:ribonuclease P protein component